MYIRRFRSAHCSIPTPTLLRATAPPDCNAPAADVGLFQLRALLPECVERAEPYSPSWTGNIGAGYAFDVGHRFSITPRVDFSYMSGQWTSVFQNAAERLQERKLLNANITLKREGWKVVAYGTNLTKQYYITGQTGFQNFWGAPREFGVRFNAQFKRIAVMTSSIRIIVPLASILLLASPACAADPAATAAPGLSFAFEELVTLAPDVKVGATGLGKRNIVPITGGTFSGPGISGTIIPGGWDWQVAPMAACKLRPIICCAPMMAW
jgi:hypothetical protein